MVVAGAVTIAVLVAVLLFASHLWDAHYPCAGANGIEYNWDGSDYTCREWHGDPVFDVADTPTP